MQISITPNVISITRCQISREIFLRNWMAPYLWSFVLVFRSVYYCSVRSNKPIIVQLLAVSRWSMSSRHSVTVSQSHPVTASLWHAVADIESVIMLNQPNRSLYSCWLFHVGRSIEYAPVSCHHVTVSPSHWLSQSEPVTVNLWPRHRVTLSPSLCLFQVIGNGASSGQCIDASTSKTNAFA